MKRVLNWLTLFTSTSTLLCCALPALFVALGAGGLLVSLLGEWPQLIWLSEHKTFTFALSGGLIALSGLLQWRARLEPCPIDAAAACQDARNVGRSALLLSVAVYAVGATFAFVLPLFG